MKMSPNSRLGFFAVILLIVSAFEVSGLSRFLPQYGDNQESTIDDTIVEAAQYVMKIATSSEIAMRRAIEATKKGNQETISDIMTDSSATTEQEYTSTTQQTVTKEEPSNESTYLESSVTETNVENDKLRTDRSNLDSYSSITVSNDKSSSITIDKINHEVTNSSETTSLLGSSELDSEMNGTTRKTTTEEINENTDEQPKETMVGEQTELGTTPSSWKKYTVIERKSVEKPKNETEIFVIENDLAKADTAQSQVAVNKSQNKSSEILITENRKQNLAAVVTQKTSGVFDTTPTTSAETPLTNKFDVISSKRGGYLTLTATTSTKPSGMSNEDVQDPEEKTIATKSQSQLNDDALNEELLKEEMLMNTFKVQSLSEEEKESKVRNVNTMMKADSPSSVTDEKLSVKPIAKNPSLYTVSSNYKPLKKIDVQPAKPFQRDPDDNSWRNESISSLGIVFKPKNPTKAFTEVLKSKTETEFGVVPKGGNKTETPELRERLGKIAEVRKSKKKKVDQFGNTFYTDYEENNVSAEKISTTRTTPNVKSTSYRNPSFVGHEVTPNVATTQKLRTSKNKISDLSHYDSSNEDESDYSNLSNIDIKKFTAGRIDTTISPLPIVEAFTKPIRDFVYDRKPTIQYFPPRQKQNLPERKDRLSVEPGKQKLPINTISTSIPTYNKSPLLYTTLPPLYLFNNGIRPKTQESTPTIKPQENDQPSRFSPSPQISINNHGYSVVKNDGDFNKASYVIKHYRDFDDAPKPAYSHTGVDRHGDDETNPDPLNGANKFKSNMPDYDYDKDVLNRFVDHFNQNSERFKVDFPILFNSNDVTHKKSQGGGQPISSSVYQKNIFDEAIAEKTSNFLPRDCDANCINVELSPAYELHYYVPDQEEMVPKATILPYPYKI